MQLSRYHLERLREDGEFILYRAHATHLEPPSVLLLAPASSRPSPETLEKIDHEYSLRSDLDSAWAAPPLALSERHGQRTLVLEDPGGETLDGLLSGPMEIEQFLRFSVGLATALGKLHERRLIHKDVKPANVFVNPASGHVRLIGFGIASRLRREHQAPAPPELIAGTLPYMAPEQTGRMNRSVDSRSDLYALGVTLYQMLTGSLPFTASDPLEWVHCHIAKRPTPPAELLNNVPAPVSAIVLKLLAKTPEERYHTACGVENDLRRCLAEWQSHRSIVAFPLGQDDAPDRLVIPEKLYGRSREIDTLLAAFDRAAAGGLPELVLVSGYSGIGKSAVVNELHKALVPSQGLFASGKFDQYKREIPYATVAQAFEGLIRAILSRREEELAKWRGALDEALDGKGQLIVGLVPELKAVIGEQPPVPELPQPDAQRRFHSVFRRFVSVFARPEHPLVLFLDDLQWLDAATLDLMEDLLTQSDVKNFMLIGAYRDNEVDSAHPLLRKVAAMRQAGALLRHIVLSPLRAQDLEHLVAESLHCEVDRAAPLARLVHEKTSGNPFFAIQFLSALREEELLSFDHAGRRWSWDLARIHAKGYTDNVVELMVGKVMRLNAQTQNALKRMACLGDSAEFAIVSAACQEPMERMHAHLAEAVSEGYLLRSSESYRFLHDRVQEAVYSLIPEEQRSEAHLRIGRLLAAHLSPGDLEDRIFEVVNHLNRGARLINSRAEKRQVAEFNLIAGKRAKASAAYSSALTYMVAGSALLAGDDWESRRDLVFESEFLRAECEFFTGALEMAEGRLKMLSTRAANPREQSRVECMRIEVYTTLDQTDRAVDVCLEYLEKVGISWSPHPTQEEARLEYDGVWSQLGNRAIEELIDLPLMSDPASLATMDVMNKAIAPAFFTDPNLLGLITCRMVNLSLQQGHTDGSCFAYQWFGMVAGARFGNYKGGFRFGRLGYDLIQQRGLKLFEARTYMCFAQFVVPWTQHARMSCALLRRAFEIASKTGDLTYAAYTCNDLNTYLIATAEPLGELQAEVEKSLEFVRTIGFGLIVDIISTQRALVLALRGMTSTVGSFDEASFNEIEFQRHLTGNPRLAIAECWYWIRKLQAYVIARDSASAVAASRKAERLLWTSASFFEEAEYHFYSALARAGVSKGLNSNQDHQDFEALLSHHRRLEKWAENCPANFDDRSALVGAEIARLEGREIDAVRLYERAIASARANGFLHNEALANELAAELYLALGLDRIAQDHLRDARYCYLRWGADGKVRQLDALYPRRQEESSTPTSTGAIVAPAELLDLATVIKVSQAVSGEMILEKLIDTLLVTALQHAGAERGLLILLRAGEMKIAAEAATVGETIAVHLLSRVPASSEAPESIFQYVLRTKEGVILDDASVGSHSFADSYLARTNARSVLCLPLVRQGMLTGMLYLENRLASHVFTRSRIAALKLLASLAAISLENARLYSELGQTEAYLTEAQRLSLTGSVGWTPSSNELIWSRETYRIFDYDPAIRPTPELVLQRVHPEDRDLLQRMIDRASHTGEDWDLDHRLLMPDGSVKHIHVVAHGARDQSTGELRFLGAVMDVTASRQSQQALERAFDEIRTLKDQLQSENIVLREEVDKTSMFEQIVGTSAPLRRVLSRISKVAPTDSGVLVTGETGTGKELVARAIHRRSRRSARAFVSVNCAAIPRDLIASELFGHEKGAFTGATQRRIGRFELADGGTIFLDEVGELPPETQVTLLRVLQEREFERIGGAGPIRTDVRVIAATNRDLEAAIAAGTFRSDLFYRLNVFPIEIPSLRDRSEDIPLLVEYFIDRLARQAGKRFRAVNKRSLDLLQSYHWPGNIRELQNVIERSVIVCETENFTIDESWLSRKPTVSVPRSGVEPLRKLPSQEKEIIEAALSATGGRVYGPTGAAAKLGVPRSTLEHKIRTLKINKNRFRLSDSVKDS